jgi:hypothetical protein
MPFRPGHKLRVPYPGRVFLRPGWDTTILNRPAAAENLTLPLLLPE